MSDNYDRIAEFRKRFYETGQFYAPFAENFFRAVRDDGKEYAAEDSRRHVEEAALFLEQAQTVYTKA